MTSLRSQPTIIGLSPDFSKPALQIDFGGPLQDNGGIAIKERIA
jgi:hypothetical protein